MRSERAFGMAKANKRTVEFKNDYVLGFIIAKYLP